MMKKTIFIIILIFFILISGNLFGQKMSNDAMIVVSQINRLTDNLLSSVGSDQCRIAVLPFEFNRERIETKGLGEAAAILISKALVNKKNIIVIERQKIKEIVDEIKLSLSGLTQNELKAGELLEVDYLIAGAVTEIGSNFLIAARLVKVESGNIIQLSSIDMPAYNFVNVSSNLVQIKRYPITAAFRSMIIPGWGQYYNDRPGKGNFILGTELLFAGAAISTYLLYRQSKDGYDRAQERSVAVDKFKDMEKYSKINWISLGAMGIIWLYAIIDSYKDANDLLKRYSHSQNNKYDKLSYYYGPMLMKDKFLLSMQINF